MDIDRLGIEATLGYFVASVAGNALRYAQLTLLINPLLIALLKSALLLVAITIILSIHRASMPSVALLVALIIVGINL